MDESPRTCAIVLKYFTFFTNDASRSCRLTALHSFKIIVLPVTAFSALASASPIAFCESPAKIGITCESLFFSASCDANAAHSAFLLNAKELHEL